MKTENENKKSTVKPEKKKTRPPKEFDKLQFEKLCEIQCTESEICHVFMTTDKTLNSWCRRIYGKRFSEVFKEKRTGGRVALRRWQYQAAEQGNTTMLIWLGKQHLGQAEKPEKTDPEQIKISDEVESLLSELEME